LLARLAGTALATERLAVEQVSAGEVRAGASTPETLDGLTVQALGLRAIAEQRVRTRLEPEHPVGGGGPSLLGQLTIGTGRGILCPTECGSLDELDHSPVRNAQLVANFSRPLSGGQRRLIAAQPIVE